MKITHVFAAIKEEDREEFDELFVKDEEEEEDEEEQEEEKNKKMKTADGPEVYLFNFLKAMETKQVKFYLGGMIMGELIGKIVEMPVHVSMQVIWAYSEIRTLFKACFLQWVSKTKNSTIFEHVWPIGSTKTEEFYASLDCGKEFTICLAKER